MKRWLNLTQHWAWMILLLLCVAGLASRQIDRFPISVDELLSMNNAGYIGHDTSLTTILMNLETNSAQHVPTYFLLLGTLSHIFGWTPPALRMIGVWCGLLALAGVYRLGRDHHSPAAGLYSAMFVAGLTLYSFYYAHIRMYTLLTATTTLFLWAYLRYSRTTYPFQLRQKALLATSTLLFLSSHIFSITLMIPIGLYHVLFVSKSRRWMAVSLTIIVGGVPLIAWLPVLLKGFRHTSTFSIVTSNALTPPEIIYHMLMVYSNSVIPLLLLGLALAVYRSLNVQPQLRRWLGWMVSTATLIVLLGTVSPIIPPDRMRYTLVLMIPLSVMFGMVLAQFRYHVVLAGMVLAVWFGADLWMHRTHDMSTYLGGRMNIYNMPRLDKSAPLIAGATDSDTFILGFSNHRDLTLPVRHGNSIQDFYYEQNDRQHYSIFLPQEELKSDEAIKSDLLLALSDRVRVALVIDNRQRPSQRLRTLYEQILSEKYHNCASIQLTDHFNLTYYELLYIDCDPN